MMKNTVIEYYNAYDEDKSLLGYNLYGLVILEKI